MEIKCYEERNQLNQKVQQAKVRHCQESKSEERQLLEMVLINSNGFNDFNDFNQNTEIERGCAVLYIQRARQEYYPPSLRSGGYCRSMIC